MSEQPTGTGAPAAAPAAVDPAAEAQAAALRLLKQRRDGRDYFEEQIDKTLAALLARNSATWWWRIAAIIIGAALAVGALGFYVAGYRQWQQYELAAAGFGILLIVIALRYLRGRKGGTLREIEQGVDAVRENDLAVLIARADERLAFVGDTDLKQKLVLRGFPDKQRLPGAFFAGRIGSDGVSRFTPVGVTVFALGPDTVAAFKGAIDLTSGQILYERLVEFPYADIRALELVVSTRDDAEAEAEAQKKIGAVKAIKEAKAMRARARRPQKDKEALTIHLSSAVSVETVLSDRGFVDAWRGGALGMISPVESEEHCRAVWQTLRERWRKALAA